LIQLTVTNLKYIFTFIW